MADQRPDGPEDNTITPARFNRLVGAYQRALGVLTPEQRAELKAARPDAPDVDQPDEDRQEQQQQWEPGTRLVVTDDGSLEEDFPPTPQSPNAANRAAASALWPEKYPTREKPVDTSSGWV